MGLRPSLIPCRRRAVVLVIALVAVAAGLLVAPGRAGAATGQLLSPNVAMYPRAFRLAHSGSADGRIIADATSFPAQGPVGAIFESTHNGGSFRQVGAVADPLAAGGLCCTTLFELPRRIGSMPAGTLLWAGTIGQGVTTDRRMSLRIWRSNDLGRHWSFLSACAQAPNGGGLWEPELSVDAYGRLVCHFSDETHQPTYSQLLARTVSTDGVHWSAERFTVASTDPNHRPGMANVRRLPGGSYLMTYEVCGTGDQYDCAVHYRTSRDGWNWGDPRDIGPMIHSPSGQYFTHTPTIATATGGRLLLVGQVLNNADGGVAAGNGDTLFETGPGGHGGWSAVAAPVSVPDARNDVCPNYSSTLVALGGAGVRVLEIATDYGSDNVCRGYFATGSVR
jgi:hypothetical protein